MNKYLLLATVQDRIPMLRDCIDSIHRFLPEWKLIIVAQEYTAADIATVQALAPAADLIILPERSGPHNAKIAGLKSISDREIENYIVCSIDDDMEFIPETNLNPCAMKALEPTVGFVEANWVKALSILPKRNIVDVFAPQPIVYTGGGLVFDRKIANLVLQIPEGAYFCDNSEWSLKAYLAGFTNLRYRGSQTLHKILSAGGRRAWVKLGDKKIPDPAYLPMREGKALGKENNYLVGDSADLTPLARETHKKNKSFITAILKDVINETAI